MVDILRIELDSTWRGKTTTVGRYIPRARSGKFERVGDGGLIGAICRDMLPHNDPNALVEVWRGKRLCFDKTPLKTWAGLTVSEGARSICFAKYVPFEERFTKVAEHDNRTAKAA